MNATLTLNYWTLIGLAVGGASLFYFAGVVTMGWMMNKIHTVMTYPCCDHCYDEFGHRSHAPNRHTVPCNETVNVVDSIEYGVYEVKCQGVNDAQD